MMENGFASTRCHSSASISSPSTPSSMKGGRPPRPSPGTGNASSEDEGAVAAMGAFGHEAQQSPPAMTPQRTNPSIVGSEAVAEEQPP
jgi:hypothetical protein